MCEPLVSDQCVLSNVLVSLATKQCVCIIRLWLLQISMYSTEFKEQLCSVSTWFLLESLAWKSSVKDVQVAPGNIGVRYFNSHIFLAITLELIQNILLEWIYS